MTQMNRKPKSFEQIKAEQEKKIEERMVDLGGGIMIDPEDEKYVNPSEELLLKMAGGDMNMIQKTGKAGSELRTILAQRVSSLIIFLI